MCKRSLFAFIVYVHVQTGRRSHRMRWSEQFYLHSSRDLELDSRHSPPQSPLEADREPLISSSLLLVVLTNSITSVSKNCSKTRRVVVLYKGWIRGLLDYLSVLGTGWLLRWCNGKESTCQCRRPRWKDPLEEGMATHSSILAGKIPWTGEPGRLQSIGSQRVRHN